MLVLEDQHVPGHLGGDVGVAVAVAADPGAEGQRAGLLRQRHADPLQLGGQVLQDVADRARVQLVQVVDGVAGLVGGLGAHHAQLVGLPQQVDVLGQPQVGAAPVAGGGGRGVQQFGDTAQLVQHRAAGGLGGVGGEHRPDVEVLDALADVRLVAVLEQVGGLREQAALGRAAGPQVAAAVHLLGDVGQVEVGGEGADQAWPRSPGRSRRAGRRRPRRRCGSGRVPSRRGRGVPGPPAGPGCRPAVRPGGGCRLAGLYCCPGACRRCSQVRLLVQWNGRRLRYERLADRAVRPLQDRSPSCRRDGQPIRRTTGPARGGDGRWRGRGGRAGAGPGRSAASRTA